MNIPKPDFEAPIFVHADGIHGTEIYFNWVQRTVGFGQLSVNRTEDGKLQIMNECMSKEWVRRALHAYVDALVDAAELME